MPDLALAPAPERATGLKIGPRLRAWLRAVAGEPLAQFVACGLLLSIGVHVWNGHRDHYLIHVRAEDRRLIAERYRLTFGRAPGPAELRELIHQHIDEEIQVREALALGLDQNDEIVRRRLIQKYEFLLSDAGPGPLAPGELERWFEQNSRRYLIATRVTFSQIYVATDPGVEASRMRALGILHQVQKLEVARAPGLGDVFPGPSDVGELAPQDAQRLFGRSELSEALFTLTPGHWAGPLRSGYGWHLVYVSSRRAAALPPLADIRDRVLADYREERQQAADVRRLAALRQRYTIDEDDAP